MIVAEICVIMWFIYHFAYQGGSSHQRFGHRYPLVSVTLRIGIYIAILH